MHSTWSLRLLIPGLTQPFGWKIFPLNGIAEANVLQHTGEKQLWKCNDAPTVEVLLPEYCIEKRPAIINDCLGDSPHDFWGEFRTELLDLWQVHD
jgi:hypothetical protein